LETKGSSNGIDRELREETTSVSDSSRHINNYIFGEIDKEAVFGEPELCDPFVEG
jgi:hypothetical protein